MATIYGTDLDDVLNGGSGKDKIYGKAGNDTLYGNAGDDKLYGQEGNDRLFGGTGSDVFYHAKVDGHDTIADYTEGKDLIFVNSGLISKTVANNGTLKFTVEKGSITLENVAASRVISLKDKRGDYTASADSIVLESNFKGTMDSSTFLATVTTIDGSAATEAVKLNGNNNDNVITGGSGNDTLTGSGGKDTLSGGAGDDYLYGGQGDDTLTGGAGQDTFAYGKGHGNDVVRDYRKGEDVIEITKGGISKTTVNENNDLVYTIGDGSLTLRNVGTKAVSIKDTNGSYQASGTNIVLNEDYTGTINAAQFYAGVTAVKGQATTADVVFKGNANGNELYGGSGNNEMYGEKGDDTVYGYAGNDTLYGGAGNDKLYGGAGNDTLYGDSGSDSLYGEGGSNTLYGGNGKDKLYSKSGSDTLAGGIGSDVYVLQSAFTSGTLISIDQSDKAKGDSDTLQLRTLHKEDVTYALSGGVLTITDKNTKGKVLVSGWDVNPLTSIQFADKTVVTRAEIEEALAGGGVTLYGTDGDDVLNGGNGDDTIYGLAGNDTLSGGAGNDTLTGGAGKDTFVYTSGNDTITDYTAGEDCLQTGDEQSINGFTVNNGLVNLSVCTTSYEDAGTVTLNAGDEAIDITDYWGHYTLTTGDAPCMTLSSVKTVGSSGMFTIAHFNQIIEVDASAVNVEGILDIGGNDRDNIITGSNGENFIHSGIGNDTLYGGADKDYLAGNEGDDELWGYAGNDELYGGDGADQLYGGEGDDTLTGGAGNDLFVHTGGSDKITDYTYGEDRLQVDEEQLITGFTISNNVAQFTVCTTDDEDAGTVKLMNITDNTFEITDHRGDYTLSADDEACIVVNRLGYNVGYEGLFSAFSFNQIKEIDATAINLEGVLYIYGNAQDNVIWGSDGAQNYILSVKGDNRVYGGALMDSLYGAEGDDELYGYGGDDTLYGRAGADELYGYAGDDTLEGEDGDDFLSGGDGDDTLIGGDGSDRFFFNNSSTRGNDIIYDYEAGETIEFATKGMYSGNYELENDNVILHYTDNCGSIKIVGGKGMTASFVNSSVSTQTFN